MNDYTSYSAEELAMDTSFRNWICQPDEDEHSTQFWETWQHEHPQKKELIETAAALVSMLHLPKQHLPAWEIESEIEEVRKRIEMAAQATPPVKKLYERAPWWRVAAAIAGLLFASSLTYFFLHRQFNPTEYVTRYNEVKEVELPDGSHVSLSANSRLKISEGWWSSMHSVFADRQPVSREVWLDGTAYFKVTHLSRNKLVDQPVKFIVHAANVNVEVVGTEFNVSNRPEKVKVLLNSGRIQLQIQETKQPHLLAMKPGDLMELVKQDKTYQLKQVNLKRYTSWRDGELKFDHTSIAEAASLIEEAYGYPVVIQPALLRKRELSGVIQNRDLEFLLSTLATLLDIKAYQKGNRIILYDQTMDK